MISFQGIRLFLSYQRYSALVGALAIATGLVSTQLLRGSMGLPSWLRYTGGVALAIATLVGLRFAWFIASQYPRKRRATHLALRRIALGRFRPQSLAHYCEDPCFRVVAREILRHSELSRVKQREVYRELVAKSREPAFVTLNDPEADNGVSVHCDL